MQEQTPGYVKSERHGSTISLNSIIRKVIRFPGLADGSRHPDSWQRDWMMKSE